VGVEVVEDRTAGSRCDDGFLRLRRLTLRNVLADGTRSRPYPCDVMSRANVDAVAVVLYQVDEAKGAARPHVRVALKRGWRAPIWLRREKRLVQPDAAQVGAIVEVVAGMLEGGDAGRTGVARRAALECEEEAGVAVPPSRIEPLGGPSFASPGVTDEKVHFRAARADLDRRAEPKGDGSPMEEGGEVVVMSLRDAIRACREGDIPDMKTEVALLRLADRLGYLPQVDAFVGDLPPRLAVRAQGLGVPRAVPRPRGRRATKRGAR
jgi:ADP-ribose pyrophosphatase